MHDAAEPSTTDTAGSDTPGSDTAVPEAVILFWRPGCSFCASLMFQLEQTDLPLVEINIWEDPRAAETVRSIANGNETVPTVVVGEVAMVNPSAAQVLAAVTDHAPHLLGTGTS